MKDFLWSVRDHFPNAEDRGQIDEIIKELEGTRSIAEVREDIEEQGDFMDKDPTATTLLINHDRWFLKEGK